jgi:hypothetical protein
MPIMVVKDDFDKFGNFIVFSCVAIEAIEVAGTGTGHKRHK